MKEEIKDSLLETGLNDEELVDKLYRIARYQYMLTTDQDSENRFDQVVKPLLADWVLAVSKSDTSKRDLTSAVTAIHKQADILSAALRSHFRENRESYITNGSAEHLLGETRHLYNFVRKDLNVQILKAMDYDAVCLGFTRALTAAKSSMLSSPVSRLYKITLLFIRSTGVDQTFVDWSGSFIFVSLLVSIQ
jgi:hypothetical protein